MGEAVWGRQSRTLPGPGYDGMMAAKCWGPRRDTPASLRHADRSADERIAYTLAQIPYHFYVREIDRDWFPHIDRFYGTSLGVYRLSAGQKVWFGSWAKGGFDTCVHSFQKAGTHAWNCSSMCVQQGYTEAISESSKIISFA